MVLGIVLPVLWYHTLYHNAKDERLIQSKVN
jgi:hypothetical protein